MGRRERTVVLLMVALCVIVLAGEALAATSPSCRYSSTFERTDDGYSYSFSSDVSSEFNLVLTDNSGRRSVETLYIYYDSDHGSLMTYPDTFLKEVEAHLSDNGFRNYRAVDTEELLQVLDREPGRSGVMMFTGAIPEGAAGKLLSWVKAGGTLYWSTGVIGANVSRDDGSVVSLETSLEADFLGSECTYPGKSVGDEFAEGDEMSQYLGLESHYLSCPVNTDLLTIEHSALGYVSGSLSEIVLVSCGEGSVCVVSGLYKQALANDLSRVVCCGLTVGSSLVFHDSESVSSGHGHSGEVDLVLQKGHEYCCCIYLTGFISSYGAVYRDVVD